MRFYLGASSSGSVKCRLTASVRKSEAKARETIKIERKNRPPITRKMGAKNMLEIKSLLWTAAIAVIAFAINGKADVLVYVRGTTTVWFYFLLTFALLSINGHSFSQWKSSTISRPASAHHFRWTECELWQFRPTNRTPVRRSRRRRRPTARTSTGWWLSPAGTARSRWK